MKKSLLLLLFCFITFLGKAEEPIAKYVNNLNDVRSNANWINEKKELQGDLNYFSRMDSTNLYGLGINEPFPEAAKGNNLEIVITARTKCNVPGSGFGLALSIKSGDSTITWESKDVEFKNIDQWHYFEKKFKVPANFVTDKNSFLIYPWIKNNNSSVSIDEMVIRIYPLEIKSSNHLTVGKPIPNFNKIVYGERYNVYIDTFRVNVSIISIAGDTIVSSVQNILSTDQSYYTVGLFNKLNITEFGEIKKIEMIGDALAFSGVLNKRSVGNIGGPPNEVVKLEIVINDHSGEITFNWKFKSFQNWLISRAAMIVHYSVAFNSAIKSNGEINSNKKVSSFWLNDGQIILDGNQESYLIKANSNISSLQLFPSQDLFLVNFTSSEDNPMLHFPLRSKNENLKEDVSLLMFKKDSVIEGSFSIIPIRHEQPLLRKLKNPNGFLSSLVWTEHADFSDIRTQRAVMFGSEEIVNADSAISGFVGHGIPITKSVFYDNPTKEKNSKRDKRFKTPSISIKRSPEFLDLLKQLKKKEFEICLHTPDPYTTNRKLAEEAMSFMKENFESVNWIDHGYDNSPKSNREDINCDGLDSTSKFYMGDLFKKYGVKYNWSSYYEDYGTFANASFNSFFTNPYSGWGDSYAAPEYFRNPKNGSLISWRTTYTLDPPDGSLWSYYFDDVRLNDLVQSKGDCILHCYLARVDSTTGFYSYVNGKIVVNPEFDKVLAKLKRYMDENKIWVTTVEKLLDYRLQLENVKIQYLKNNQVVVYNANTDVVKGVSVISNSSSISAGEKNIRLKKVDGETIAIFDLAPNEKLILDLR